MQELNLEVRQKVWTIQSGYCELIEVDKAAQYCFITLNKGGRRNCYDKFGRYNDDHDNPSLFESNPFEPVLVQENKDGWIESKGNKAELINALCSVLDCPPLKASVKDIAKDKLQKLLESL